VPPTVNMYIFEKICIYLEIPQVCFVGSDELKNNG